MTATTMILLDESAASALAAATAGSRFTLAPEQIRAGPHAGQYVLGLHALEDLHHQHLQPMLAALPTLTFEWDEYFPPRDS